MQKFQRDEYKVIAETDLNHFQNCVNASIRDGWECHGGISVCKPNPLSEFHYFQAMIYRP